MRRFSSALSYANVVSTVCLFILLGGGAYAATKLPRNSVGPAQIKRGAVASSEVKNRSLLARDFKRGQLPRGPAGPAGRPGAHGADAYQFNAIARVTSGGDIDPGSSRGGQLLSSGRLDEGRYCVLVLVQTPNSDVVTAPKNAVVTPEDEDRTASVKTTPQSSPDCVSGTLVTLTNTVDDTREDGAFQILLTS